MAPALHGAGTGGCMNDRFALFRRNHARTLRCRSVSESRVRAVRCLGRRIFGMQISLCDGLTAALAAYRENGHFWQDRSLCRQPSSRTEKRSLGLASAPNRSLSDSLFGSVQRIVAAERILRVWTFPQVVAAASCGNQALVRPEAGMTGCTTCRHPAATDSAT
jgi:hypothetical protein